MAEPSNSQQQHESRAETPSSPEHQPPALDDATRAVLLPKPWESTLSGYTPPAGHKPELPRRRSGRFDLSPGTGGLYTHLMGVGEQDLLGEIANLDLVSLHRNKPESLDALRAATDNPNSTDSETDHGSPFAGIIKAYEAGGLRKILGALREMPDNESPATASDEEGSADKDRPNLTDGESSSGDIG